MTARVHASAVLHRRSLRRHAATARALAEPIRITDGWFTPPAATGHGIVFDRATLGADAVDA